MLAIAAGVTFYALLAIFPAVAALVALYSPFADPATIRSHLDSLTSLLPGGAIDVIGGQITRVAAQGGVTLGLTSLAGLAVSLWSHMAAPAPKRKWNTVQSSLHEAASISTDSGHL